MTPVSGKPVFGIEIAYDDGYLHDVWVVWISAPSLPHRERREFHSRRDAERFARSHRKVRKYVRELEREREDEKGARWSLGPSGVIGSEVRDD